nr:reverse transcriptase domain-containing protein [Tanacetum cinerariifolium]
MRTRSSSNLLGESSNLTSLNLKRRNRKRSKQPFILEESPVDTMADQLLRAPTEGYAEAIVVPSILVDHFEFKHTDQDALNSAAGGNLLERRTQDMLMIIKNKSKVRNSRNKSVVSQVKSSDANSNSSSEIAKITHAFNQQTSAVTTAMTAIFKQFQATPPPAFVKAFEEICVTCGGAHPYYQCLAAGGNTFLELRNNIQGYVAAAAVNYNQGNSGYRPSGVANQIRPPGFAQPNVKNNQSRFSQPQGYNRGNNFNPDQSYQAPTQQNHSVPLSELEKIKRVNEANMKSMQTQINNVKNELRNEMKNSIQASMDPLHPNIPYPSRMYKQKQQEKDEVQIHKFWQMFKKLHINITLADALILIPKYQKMLQALLSNEKLLELANTPLNENFSAVILKKLPEKLRDPRKFLISCGFSKLKCKALADLGASINLMSLSVWTKLGLPELISTRMTHELANRAICTPARIARNVCVLVGKFIFSADFVIVDYESDPRVLLILGRPFLRTARALVDVNREEMILRDGDERLTLNMRHDTLSYSNQPQKESINMINIYDDSKNNDLPFDIESDLKEIEYLLHHDLIKDVDSILEDSIYQSNLADLNDNLVDTMPEMFTDEHALDYSSPPLYDEYDDDMFEVESDIENVYNDPFDSKGEKIKESKLLIDELDLPSDFLPSPKYDSFLSEDFFKVDALPSTNNEDKVFNPGILIQENLFEVITRVTPDKNAKILAISYASLILEDFDPPLYELSFFKEVLRSKILLSFSSENEEKVFKPGIITSEEVHSSLIPKQSHQGYKVLKIIKILKSPTKIFLFSHREDIHIMDVPCLHFYPP